MTKEMIGVQSSLLLYKTLISILEGWLNTTFILFGYR